jgi:histidyl-tRNA synthetase
LDLSLARGLDYYTGFILEIVQEGSGVGSICGGGRYDELVGMFSNKRIPSCGASIGIERVLMLMEEKYQRGYAVRET